MKKYLSLLIITLAIVILSGCAPKREEIKYKGEEGTIVFNVKKNSNIKITTDKTDFRTSREQAMLIGKDFKIGIEFDDDFGYFYEGDFSKLKEAYEYYDFKEVTYSNIKGISFFNDSYNRYNIVLPCNDSKEYILSLTVYGNKDTESAAKEAMKNEEVLDVLNNITSLKSVK